MTSSTIGGCIGTRLMALRRRTSGAGSRGMASMMRLLELLAGLREGSRNLDRWQRKAVKAARKQGMTWDDIGTACGVSRQAAWERFSSDGA